MIVDWQYYIKKMNDVYNDQKEYTIVNMKDDNLSKFVFNQQKHVDKVLKKLVESNSMIEKKIVETRR